MTNDEIPNQTSPFYNVQPTSHTSEKRIFPSLPYTSENLKFINKFNCQFSDIKDTEYITLCSMLLKYKTCYATHKNDVGKISTPFRIRLKPNAQLMTQRLSKVPIHYRDKFNVLLKELEKYNIIKQIGSKFTPFLHQLKNYILISNHFTIFYMRTLLGNGQTNTKVFSKNLKCLSLLKQN